MLYLNKTLVGFAFRVINVSSLARVAESRTVIKTEFRQCLTRTCRKLFSLILANVSDI